MGFLKGTLVVVVILVKGHAFPTIVKVLPVGCDPLALVGKFTPVEDNIGLLETKFNEDAILMGVFPDEVTGSVNLTFLVLFIRVTAISLSPKSLMQGQIFEVVVDEVIKSMTRRPQELDSLAVFCKDLDHSVDLPEVLDAFSFGALVDSSSFLAHLLFKPRSDPAEGSSSLSSSSRPLFNVTVSPYVSRFIGTNQSFIEILLLI
nr:hypothetical protein [Tanacetum cinerariifolium]